MKHVIVPLTENHLFSKTYTRGKCVVGKYCAVYLLVNFKKAPDGTPQKTRLGITVNRKLGKACRRNRVKRMIREAYRENAFLVRDGYFMVIAARTAAFAPRLKTPSLSKELNAILSSPDFYDLKASSPSRKTKIGGKHGGGAPDKTKTNRPAPKSSPAPRCSDVPPVPGKNGDTV